MADESAPPQSDPAEYARGQLRQREWAQIRLLRDLVKWHLKERGWGAQGRLARKTGVSPQWLSDLVSDAEAGWPKSISQPRHEAIFEAIGMPLPIDRGVRMAPAGSRLLEPLEREVIKALRHLPAEAIQPVLWHARATHRALIEREGFQPCRRCGEMIPEKELARKRSNGLCRNCAAPAYDVPDVVLPADYVKEGRTKGRQGGNHGD